MNPPNAHAAHVLRPALLAGCTYFAVVFSAGFVLGVVRVLWLQGRLGETVAVLVELPVILTVAWLACTRIADRSRVIPRIGPRLVMGAVALGLLLAAELVLSVSLAGRTPLEHFALYREPAAQLGLAGQLLFGLMPSLAGRRRRG